MSQISKINKKLSQWRVLIEQYKNESSKLQAHITRHLRTIWLQSSKFKKCDIQKLIDEAGILLLKKPLGKIL